MLPDNPIAIIIWIIIVAIICSIIALIDLLCCKSKCNEESKPLIV